MANVDAIVQEGITAVKAGRRDEARRILVRATELDERNEQAWLWLSACVDSIDEQRICLENVLSINPANQKARRGLDTLNKKAPASPPPPSVNPFSDTGFDSNPYAGTGFDSNPYGSGTNDPAIGTGWNGFDTGKADTPSTPSSVEWGNPDRAPAYGSGKDVPLPSSDEYDNWVSGLQLGGSSSDAAPADASFPKPPVGEYDQWTNNLQLGGSSSDAEATTGYDTGFDPLSGPFGSSSQTADDSNSAFDTGYDPFNASPFGSSSPSEPDAFDLPAPKASTGAFGDFGDTDASPFTSTFDNSADAFESPTAKAGDFGNDDIDLFSPSSQPPSVTERYNGRSPASTPKMGDTSRSSGDVFTRPPEKRSPSPSRASDDVFANPPEKLSSSNPFGGPSNIFSEFADTGSAQASSGAGTAFTFDNNKRKGTSPYFASIPHEIQVEGGATKPNLRLVLTIGILGLLNAISLAVLVLNLLNR